MVSTNATAVAPDPARWNEFRGYQLTTAAIVCAFFAALFTALRVYTRVALIRKYFWEDLSIVVALVRAMPGIWYQDVRIESF
jgi:hypothetical protein